jgi:hypothetical protein
MNIDLVKEISPLPEDKKANREDKEFYRSENLKDLLHRILLIFIAVAFSCLIVVFIIRLFHLVAPLCWHWLSEDQVQGVDKIFFSGAIGGILGGYLKDKLNKSG